MAQQLQTQNSLQKNRVQTAKYPSLLFVCGFMLIVFALLSIFTGPFLDLDQFPGRSKFRRNFNSETFDHQEAVLNRLTLVPISGFKFSKISQSNVDNLANDVWVSRDAELFYGCSDPAYKFASAVPKDKSNGYLTIATSGGLNQQRTGITDAVVVAWVLNATLVIPELDHHSFWKDPSNFTDIFDADWFIYSLQKYVNVLKELPTDVKDVIPYTMRVPRKSTPEYYLSKVLPILQRRHVVKLTKFDYRLSNGLERDLQKLRCMANYQALKFTKEISKMGQVLVNRMRMKKQRYVAIHLRFEQDMLAFSGCYYGGGDKERKELAAIRKRWENLPELNPERERRHGKCPLSPEEVGLMLRALGFGNDTYIYVASGEVYGGEATLGPLKYLFPNFYSKDTLLDRRELQQFAPFSSQLAALDYIVCEESDVFVTNNNGNMARILAGSRRYFGHKRTIRPNARKLNSLLINWHEMNWEIFARKVRASQKGFMGDPDEMRPGKGEFHEYPYACICKREEGLVTKKQSEDNIRYSGAKEFGNFTDQSGSALPSEKYEQYDSSFEALFLQNEDPELVEILSD